MTKELRRAIEIIISQLQSKPRNVLEVGSRSAVNQEELSDLRSLLIGSSYIGLDMQDGMGVDVVADATNIPYPDARFDMVMCLETLEHAEHPWRVAAELARVVKNKGVIILSSQQNFPIHNHPADYFRYTPYGLNSLVIKDWERLVFSISAPYEDEVKLNPRHVVLVAWGGNNFEKNRLRRALKNNQQIISGHKPYRHRLQAIIRIIKRAINEINYREEVHFFEPK